MKATPAMVAGIIDNLRRVFQVVHEHSKKAEQDTGLTGPQLWAMKIVAESEHIKVSDLAKKMYLHPATVVGIIDRLEARGLVRRNRSTADRRVVEIVLSAEGVEKVKQSPEVAQDMLVKGLKDLPKDKINRVAEGLDQLVEILGAKELPPQLILSSEINVAGKAKRRKT